MASSALLQEIQAGKRLKKAQTNDRSAPLVADEKPKSGGRAISSAGASAPIGGGGAGPPQLAGLFAGGMPKLKPAGQGKFYVYV